MNDELNEKALVELAALELKLAAPAAAVSGRELLMMQLDLIETAFVYLDELSSNVVLEDDSRIRFYKEVYPGFKALHLLVMEQYALLSDLPTRVKDLKSYYRLELAALDRFFLRYHFHYGYFSLKASELDSLFFADGVNTDSPLFPVLPFDVPTGVPVVSYLFALFHVREKMQQDLLRRLRDLDVPLSGVGSSGIIGSSSGVSSVSVMPSGELRRPFRWTGEVIFLIELAHGLHALEVINQGKTGIMELFSGLGDFFGINLGVPKRGLEDLKARKRLSKTHFIEMLREALQRKMAESDTWVRGSSGFSAGSESGGINRKSGL